MPTPQHLLDASKMPARRERGATIVEYAMLIAIVAVVAILAVAALGDDVRATFTDADMPRPVPVSPGSGPGSSGGSSPPITTTSTTSATTTTTTPAG